MARLSRSSSKIQAGLLRTFRKNAKAQIAPPKGQEPLDILAGKRGRGRPGVRASEISGRAYNYRLVFSQIWDSVGEPLLNSKTKEEVIEAFENTHYKEDFAPVASLILEVLHEPKFPKTRDSQISFLADSLAGRGRVSPRRSRDICVRERNKKVYQIIRQEYYIECTCGYEGPALRGRCPKCGPNERFIPFQNVFS